MGKERVQTGLRMPPKLAAELAKEAEEIGTSMNDYILMLIYQARRVYQGESPRASAHTEQHDGE